MRENTEILILGCGNILWGDDGFGPAVIDYLKTNYKLPENVFVENTGLSIRNILFDILLGEKKPKKIIIIDAVDKNKKPGEVFLLPIDDIPEVKTDDFSMHQAPTTNLLKEIRETGVDIVVVSCQVKYIPNQIYSGLSDELKNAIPRACDIIVSKIDNISIKNDK